MLKRVFYLPGTLFCISFTKIRIIFPAKYSNFRIYTITAIFIHLVSNETTTFLVLFKSSTISYYSIRIRFLLLFSGFIFRSRMLKGIFSFVHGVLLTHRNVKLKWKKHTSKKANGRWQIIGRFLRNASPFHRIVSLPFGICYANFQSHRVLFSFRCYLMENYNAKGNLAEQPYNPSSFFSTVYVSFFPFWFESKAEKSMCVCVCIYREFKLNTRHTSLLTTLWTLILLGYFPLLLFSWFRPHFQYKAQRQCFEAFSLHESHTLV